MWIVTSVKWTSVLMMQNWIIWSKKGSVKERQKKLNEKQTSWIGREPDGLFDIKEPLWHFKKAVPEWFPRNFRKVWYKAHRYLSNIHSNLLFYLQTETYVSRPLQPPSLPSFLITVLIYCCRISPTPFASFFPFFTHIIYLSIFIIFSHHFSVSQTFLPPLRCSLLTAQ